jgi:hypothetical protein
LELVKKYKADIIWGDTDGKVPLSDRIRMLKAIREANPNIVVNGRFARGGKQSNWGDYKNMGDKPADITSDPGGDWEAIPTTNESYSYKIDDKSHKPLSYFIEMLVKAAGYGGNLLLNVGPRGDGKIDEPDVAILEGIGKWMAVNSESIYGTTRTPIVNQSWGRVTKKGATYYMHVLDWPAGSAITLKGYYGQTSSLYRAYLLSDKTRAPLTTVKSGSDCQITIPSEAPDTICSVIVVASSVTSVEYNPGINKAGISLWGANPGAASLKMYDYRGRLAADLTQVIKIMKPGALSIPLNKYNLASGSYILRIGDGTNLRAQKTIVVR